MDILNEKIKGLVTKADKSGMPYGILKKVYDRGMAAWKTGHRPGTTPQQWAFARVNSFVTKSSGTWGKADADLAKQVRGEEVQEKRITASKIIGQVKEKLPKDADAGDYVKDFKKSDAPQFKGKSDKKKEKMAVAAYLDSKEEVELEEGGVPARFGLSNSEKMKLAKDFDKLASDRTTSPNEKIYYKNTAKYFMDNMPDKAFNDMMGGAPEHIGGTIGRRTSAIIGKDKAKKVTGYKEEFKEENCPKCDDDPCKCENIQEQIKTYNRNSLTASDKSKLSKHFSKLAKDYSLPPENQDAYKAVSDYVSMKTKRVDFDDVMKKTSAMHKQDIEIEMSRIIGKSKTKKVIESKEENIQESGHTDVASMKTQVQIATDALQKMNTELGKLGDEDDLPTWWTNKVATAVNKLDGMADYIDAMHDRGKEMNEGKRQLKDPKKETMVMKVKDAGSIMVIDKKDLQKYTSKGYIQVESNLQEKEIRHDGKGPIKMSKKEYDKINKFRKGKIRGKPHVMATIKKGGFDYNMLVPVIFEEVESNLQEKERTYTVIHIKKGKEIIKTSKGTYDAAKIYAKMKGLRSTAGVDVHLMEDNITEETVFVVRFEKEGMRFAVPFRDMKMAKDGEKILKKSAGVSGLSITKDVLKPGIKFSRKEGRIVKEENLEVSEVQEVDNSIMARATRLISQTAIREKIDPADIDMKATDLDRKAADKNIFIQLKRAQDMKGKTDVEFLDKKKQKVDIRVINKALDMFDKMKPNDKLKMQTAIGKSYRDLLKTVQRGKV